MFVLPFESLVQCCTRESVHEPAIFAQAS